MEFSSEIRLTKERLLSVIIERIQQKSLHMCLSLCLSVCSVIESNKGFSLSIFITFQLNHLQTHINKRIANLLPHPEE